MKIAYDYQAFTIYAYGGVARYYKDLTNSLLKQRQDVKIFTGIHRNYYIQSLPKGVVHGIKIYNYPPKSVKAFQWFNHGLTQHQLRRWKPDIIHETYYSSLPVLKAKAARLTTVHDMIHEIYPDMLSIPSKNKTSSQKKIVIKS